MRQYTQEHTEDWSRRIERADAVVIVTPEHNYGDPFHTQFIDAEGRVRANEIMDAAADAMLGELARLDGALRPLRHTA